MTDSARIHTWGCERHKEDTYEGCYSCDLEHSSEVSARLSTANARIDELVRALHDALTSMEAMAERLTGSSIKVDPDSPIAMARKALRLDP